MIVLYIFLAIIAIIFILLHFFIVASIKFSNKKLDLKISYLFLKFYPLREKQKKKPKNKSKDNAKIKKKQEELEKELEKEKKEYNKILEETIKKSYNKSQDTNSSIEDVLQDVLESKTPKTDTKEKENTQNQKKEKSSKKNKGSKNIKEQKEETAAEDSVSIFDKYKKYKPYIPHAKKAFKRLVKAIRIRKLKLNLAVADEDAYECAMKYGKINIAVYNTLGIISNVFNTKVDKINVLSKFNSNNTEYDFYCEIKIRPSTIIAICMIIFVNFIYTNKKLRKSNKKNKNKEMEM